MSLSLALEVSKRQLAAENSRYRSAPPNAHEALSENTDTPRKSELSSSGLSVGQIDMRVAMSDSPGRAHLPLSARELSSSSPGYAHIFHLPFR